VQDGFLVAVHDPDAGAERLVHVSLDGAADPRVDVEAALFGTRSVDDATLGGVQSYALGLATSAGFTSEEDVHEYYAISQSLAGTVTAASATFEDGGDVMVVTLGATPSSRTVPRPGRGFPISVSVDASSRTLVHYDNRSAYTADVRVYDDALQILGAATLDDLESAALAGDPTGDVIVVSCDGVTATTRRMSIDLNTVRWSDTLTVDGDATVDVATLGRAEDGRSVVVFEVTRFDGNGDTSVELVARVLAP
jgi:hypothetical protein